MHRPLRAANHREADRPCWRTCMQEVHVDRFEWKSAKNPDGIDRIAAWGPMGGVLSSRMLPCEKPIMQLQQDETIVRAHDCQRRVWRKEGAARTIAPKGEGAAVMLSGFVSEVEGGFPILTKHDVEVRYARRSDKHESVRLVCVHKDALPQLAQNSMPGCHRGGAALFLGTFDL